MAKSNSLATIALLALCIFVGAGLRLADLGARPPWTDEIATLAFSLGNGFQEVPLDRFISAATLLAPLQPDPSATFGDAAASLFAESTHPPLYFLLTHGWLRAFPPADRAIAGLVSLWGARALSVLFGILAIPATFAVGSLAWRSRPAALGGAALMALSPLAVFLARDARHYTLAMLWVLAALACLSRALRATSQRRPLPVGWCLLWVGVNCGGMATHYFFSFSLLAQGLACVDLARSQFPRLGGPVWQRLYGVAAGTAVGGLVWLPLLGSVLDNPASRWAYGIGDWWYRPVQFFLWLASAIVLPPSAPSVGVPLPAVIATGLLALGFLAWVLPQLVGIVRASSRQDPVLRGLGIYTIALPLLFLVSTYGFGLDLTLAPRFNFAWLPAALLLAGGALASLPRRAIALVLCVSFLGGCVATANLGYLQNHRPDLLARVMQAGGRGEASAIISTHTHHGKTGRLMGLAWALNDATPNYFLAARYKGRYDASVAALQTQLQALPRPLDLWLVNFRADVDWDALGCQRDRPYSGLAGEYRYKLYRCQ